MVLAAIVLWLLFAFVFWCMMAGATRGDMQLEAALDRAKADRAEKCATVEKPSDKEQLSTAA